MEGVHHVETEEILVQPRMRMRVRFKWKMKTLL